MNIQVFGLFAFFGERSENTSIKGIGFKSGFSEDAQGRNGRV